MREGRIPCCVPFCRRTTAAPTAIDVDAIGWEWVCPRHWRAVPLPRRRAYARIHAIWWGADGGGMTVAAIAAHPKYGRRGVHRAAAERLWRRLKRMAIARALAHAE